MKELYRRFSCERQFIKNVSPCTLEAYQWAWKAFAPVLSGKDHVSKADVIQHIEELRSGGLSPVTVNTYVRSVNAFCRWLFEEGHAPILLRISSTAFNAQPPNLQPAPLMDMDFAIICPLVQRRMPRIRFLPIGSRLCCTLLLDPASRRCPCASLSLLLHLNVKGTSTPKLLNMLGTQKKEQRYCTLLLLGKPGRLRNFRAMLFGAGWEWLLPQVTWR